MGYLWEPWFPPITLLPGLIPSLDRVLDRLSWRGRLAESTSLGPGSSRGGRRGNGWDGRRAAEMVIPLNVFFLFLRTRVETDFMERYGVFMLLSLIY